MPDAVRLGAAAWGTGKFLPEKFPPGDFPRKVPIRRLPPRKLPPKTFPTRPPSVPRVSGVACIRGRILSPRGGGFEFEVPLQHRGGNRRGGVAAGKSPRRKSPGEVAGGGFFRGNSPPSGRLRRPTQLTGDLVARYCVFRRGSLLGAVNTDADHASRHSVCKGGRPRGAARASGDSAATSCLNRRGRSRGPAKAAGDTVARFRPSWSGRLRGPARTSVDSVSRNCLVRRGWRPRNRISPVSGRQSAKPRSRPSRCCDQILSDSPAGARPTEQRFRTRRRLF